MEPAKPADSEKRASAARAAAMVYRPKAAPLPPSRAWPVDDEPYRTAAIQYFEAAQRFYQADDYARGDYCILRGDQYRLLASMAAQVNSLGVDPLLYEKPMDQADKVATSSEGDLKAKLQELGASLREKPRPVPPVPAEVDPTMDCAYFYDMSAAFFDDSLFAKTDGDTNLADYLFGKALTYADLGDWCVKTIKSFTP